MIGRACSLFWILGSVQSLKEGGRVLPTQAAVQRSIRGVVFWVKELEELQAGKVGD
jgi:hypothetical protein